MPVTDTVWPSEGLATEGEMVRKGRTVNENVSIEAAHVRVSVYAAPPGPLGPVPTVNDP